MKAKLFIGLLTVFFIFTAASCGDNNDELADKRDNLTEGDGAWHMTLYDDSSNQLDYVSHFTKDDSVSDKIYMSNFIANDNQAYGTLSGLLISVPEQNVGNSIVSASGTISSDYQTITWDITIDGDPYTATSVPGGITKDQIVQ